MAFSPVVNSATALDDEMNYNFYDLAQGTVLPKTGTSFTPTTSVIDIGSSTYRWKSLYVDSIHADSITCYASTSVLWTKITEVYLSTSNAGRVEISSLNGDLYHTFDIITRMSAETAATMRMYFNGDSTTANYAKVNLQNSLAALYGTATAAVPICGDRIAMDTVCSSYSIAWYHLKTGQPRRGTLYRMDTVYDTTVNKMSIESNRWSNTSSTVTSLVFEIASGYTNATAYFGIWGRG